MAIDGDTDPSYVYTDKSLSRKHEVVMVSSKTKSVIDRAKRLYSEKLQMQLEARHTDQFVAIEPESGEHFVADTFDAAVKAARIAYPTRISFTMRIGQGAAFHIGGMRSQMESLTCNPFYELS